MQFIIFLVSCRWSSFFNEWRVRRKQTLRFKKKAWTEESNRDCNWVWTDLQEWLLRWIATYYPGFQLLQANSLIHLCCFRAGVGPVSWILCTELVPQRHRSLIQSLCYSINTIMVVISTFAVLPLYSVVGAYAFLILYIVPSAGCIIYLYKNLPETMGREIYEIVADLKGAKGETRSNDSTSSESLRY